VSLVWELAERSLVSIDRSANETRYRLLESVRAFARERLDERGEAATVAQGLSAWFLERLGPWCRIDRAWIGQVGGELDNLRALVPLVADGARRRRSSSPARWPASTTRRVRSAKELRKPSASLTSFRRRR